MCQACPTPRRHFLRASLALAASGALAGLSPARAAQPAQAKISPAAALQRLQEGNARYVAGKPQVRDFSPSRAARAAGQAPFAAILACADSRVAPEILFDQGLGDLFVVRVAGNVVETEGLASLEYAVHYLGVSLIMVMGHSSCGAVEAAISVERDGTQLPGHLPGLIDAIVPAVKEVRQDPAGQLLERATAANVRQAVGQLSASSPLLAPAVASGKLQVAGSVYDIASGRVVAV